MVREADKPLRGNYKESLLGLPDEIRSRVLMAAGARALANAAAACRSLHEYCNQLAEEEIRRNARHQLLSRLLRTTHLEQCQEDGPSHLTVLRWLEPGSFLHLQNCAERPPPHAAHEVHVDITGAGGAFTSIQAALNSASRGTCVRVHPGAYHEQVVVPDGVELLGAGSDVVCICGSAILHERALPVAGAEHDPLPIEPPEPAPAQWPDGAVLTCLGAAVVRGVRVSPLAPISSPFGNRPCPQRSAAVVLRRGLTREESASSRQERGVNSKYLQVLE
eukprot:CAMPEP_0114273216 /NCGR_PEP_ID=MMETSP0058-20121206/28972_1 /TAXON_ID=36894 /ORGANISM="Pyramimonas parkeae, CCMP726" /LENGTH=276 /DNA_ID=CAMNT_0001392643 /DNA_START=40 /DNA_END=867 /DNA_ORIENTATION=+